MDKKLPNYHGDGPLLGCRACDLEVGVEFSQDEGRSWWTVRTEPRYTSEAPPCTELRFMAAPWDSTGLSEWEEVKIDDGQHVLLERTYGSTVKP